jgi:hypothetical protein
VEEKLLLSHTVFPLSPLFCELHKYVTTIITDHTSNPRYTDAVNNDLSHALVVFISGDKSMGSRGMNMQIQSCYYRRRFLLN